MSWVSNIAGGFSRRLGDTGLARADGPDLDQPGLFPPGTHSAVLVTILGVEPGRIEEVIDRALGVLSRGNHVVFLTDSTDFRAFRRRRVPFEYLPPSSARSTMRAPGEWVRYLSARYQLMLAKWRPVRVVSYGNSVSAFIGRAVSPLANP